MNDTLTYEAEHQKKAGIWSRGVKCAEFFELPQGMSYKLDLYMNLKLKMIIMSTLWLWNIKYENKDDESIRKHDFQAWDRGQKSQALWNVKCTMYDARVRE